MFFWDEVPHHTRVRTMSEQDARLRRSCSASRPNTRYFESNTRTPMPGSFVWLHIYIWLATEASKMLTTIHHPVLTSVGLLLLLERDPRFRHKRITADISRWSLCGRHTQIIYQVYLFGVVGITACDRYMSASGNVWAAIVLKIRDDPEWPVKLKQNRISF